MDLQAVLDDLLPGESEQLMVGFETSDDAAVYLLDEKTALLLTVDFITPIVDDPADFGRIAAANALSDIYAMGGRPIAAMNLLAFPCTLPPEIAASVLAGASEVVREAGALIVGGHTIDDAEPKFGLSVLGIMDPAKVVRNAGASVGDILVLTKPVGTGIITTAIKRGLETEASGADTISSMTRLNRIASEAMVGVGAHAATDVTGFGVLGHVHEMMEASGTAAELDASALPLLPRALEYARQNVCPGRTTELVTWASEFTVWHSAVEQELWMRVMCDPQTSGGLLIAVGPEHDDALLERLAADGIPAAAIGRVVSGEPGSVLVT